MIKVYLVALTILGMFFGCSSSNTPGITEETVDKDYEVVRHLTLNMMEPRLISMVEGAASLEESVRSTCGGESQPIPMTDLQNKWLQIMADFHYTEALLYGPLLIPAEDLIDDQNKIRNTLYSLQNQEAQGKVIAAEILKSNKMGDKYRLRNTPNIVGLDALEYLIFAELSGQQELGADDRTCLYFTAVNKHLVEWTGTVYNSFQEMVVQPLQTPEGLTEIRSYLDAYTKGLVAYSYHTLEERKLGAPLGLEVDEGFSCTLGVDCHLLYLEHAYSKTPRLAVIEGMQAIHDAFQGTFNGEKVGMGFLVYVQSPVQTKSLGEGDLLRTWKAMPAGDDYVEAFATYAGDQSLTNKAYAAFNEVDQFNNWLKVDFIADLNAELPENVQGDVD